MADDARRRPYALVQREIREILLKEWDPIGIGNEPGLEDEYDAYVPVLYGLLVRDAPESEIAARLHTIETEWILGDGSVEQVCPICRNVAARLKKVPVLESAPPHEKLP